MITVGQGFVKSSYSGCDCCVEVAAEPVPSSTCGPPEIVVKVRRTKPEDDPNRPVLTFTEPEWEAFLTGMDAGPNCEFRIVQ